ncbi:MAG: LssY C-terminal domain-containing protein, partial [Alsobacter sp.]
ASDWRMATAFVLNRSYPTAPFSTLYLFGRGQDVGFQQAIDNSPRKRHHVRFWGRPVDHAEQSLDSPGFWFNSDQPAENDRAMWVGAGTKDIGLSLTRLSFEITHATDADTNRERDWVVAELVRHGVVTDVRSHLAGERLTIGPVNRYVTDGMVAVADLSPEPPARPSS